MNDTELKDWLALERRELLDAFKLAVRDYVTKLKTLHSDIYGFALLPGETYEVKSLTVVWNQSQDIKKDTAYYRYSVDEWIHWDYDALDSVTPLITDLNQKFSNLHSESEDDFEMEEFEVAHIRAYHDTFLKAFRDLKSEGVFDFPNADPFLVIWISDSESEVMRDSVRELNSPKVIEEFKSEFG